MADALARARTWTRVPYLNVALFVATVLSTLRAGASQSSFRLPIVGGGALAQAVAQAGAMVAAGLPFAAALIGILLCHEMGHYLLARAYRVDSTLPFFIPVPIGPVGTFGAVIRIRSALPSKRATLDIGAAGPFAGFAVAVPLYAWGLAHSEVRAVGDAVLETTNTGALAMVRALVRYLSTHEAAPVSGYQHFGDSLVTWAVQRLVVGRLPPGTDVFLHPVAYAAWFGFFVTALNLIPIGQLDGGHVTYALLGRRGARAFSRIVSWGLLLAGLFLCWNWLLWWAVTRFLVGDGHPPALDEAPLGPGRRVFALASLLLFAATFIPVPISL
ncbi:MAG TPA: site-2 protease family protein [Anaeromyxobacteraceae bacterium]